MYELEIELDDDFELYEELPVFENPLEQNRFWVYETTYQGKISNIIVDMYEKNRYLYFDDSSNLGTIYMLEEGELFEIDYMADFDNWNYFVKKFDNLKKMANFVCLIVGAEIEKESE